MHAKTEIRMFWDGRGINAMAFGGLEDTESRIAWNVSDEQYQQIDDDIEKGLTEYMIEQDKNPEFQAFMKEALAFDKQIRDDPDLQNADESTWEKFRDILTRSESFNATYVRIDALENALPPEFKQKVKEAQLASMAEMPFVSLHAFEALDLTDTQKQQMEKIKKELEPELEKDLEKFVENRVVLLNKFDAELAKQGGYGDNPNREEAVQKWQAILKKLMAEDREYKRIHEESQSLVKQFSTQFKIKMFDVLTGEQWARLQDLIDNPPEYAKAFRKKMKERWGESEEDEKNGVWSPGPNSWKPGDAIPEQYRIERNTRSRCPRSDQ